MEDRDMDEEIESPGDDVGGEIANADSGVLGTTLIVGADEGEEKLPEF